MHIQQNNIEPFYFGPPAMPLYGCYHAPHSVASRRCGVILCHPAGYEYIRCHRMYRQFAESLARNGFPVLRFDLSGCGDSGGEDAQGQFQQWYCDVATAIEALRSRCAMTQVCLVGLRLGGTLAMQFSMTYGNIETLVLWDPVIHGGAYITEITASHHEILRNCKSTPHAHPPAEPPTEMLESPLPDALRAELVSLDLLTVDHKPAPHILIIDSQADPRTTQLRDHLQRNGADVQFQHLPSPPIWVQSLSEGLSQVLVPKQVVRAMETWMLEVCI